MKTEKEIIEMVLKDAPEMADDGWTVYSKQRRIKGKIAKESFISGFAIGRNISATHLLNYIRQVRAEDEKRKSKK